MIGQIIPRRPDCLPRLHCNRPPVDPVVVEVNCPRPEGREHGMGLYEDWAILTPAQAVQEVVFLITYATWPCGVTKLDWLRSFNNEASTDVNATR